jgi:hypothetical protein
MIIDFVNSYNIQKKFFFVEYTQNSREVFYTFNKEYLLNSSV